MFQQQNFTHHGHTFTIEADDWPTEDTAHAAMIDLRLWTLRLRPKETANLHGALRTEAEALVHDLVYNRSATPLPAVREAQRSAIQAGLHGTKIGAPHPTLSLETSTLLPDRLPFQNG